MDKLRNIMCEPRWEGSLGRMDTCTCTAESLSSSPETSTTLLIGSAAAAAAKSFQSCSTLWDLIDGSPLGSSVPGILQTRTLEWVAISFCNAWKWKVKVKSLSRFRLLANHGLQPTRLFPLWDFPGKSTGVGCHLLLQHKRKKS